MTEAYRYGREDFLYPSSQRNKNPYQPGSVEAAEYESGKESAKADLEAGKIKYAKGEF